MEEFLLKLTILLTLLAWFGLDPSAKVFAQVECLVSGDYDGNGTVETADFEAWMVKPISKLHLAQ